MSEFDVDAYNKEQAQVSLREYEAARERLLAEVREFEARVLASLDGPLSAGAPTPSPSFGLRWREATAAARNAREWGVLDSEGAES